MRSFYFYFLLFIFSAKAALSQQTFLYEAPIKNIKRSGPYKLFLNAETRKHMTKDFRDVRILDSAGKEVPYQVVSEPVLKEKQTFTGCQLVWQKQTKGYSEILLKAIPNERISTLAFKFADSTEYTCWCLQGSKDTLQWVDIVDQQALDTSYLATYSNNYHCIYFPPKNYSYYRLKIGSAKGNSPDLISAGYFKNTVMTGRFENVFFKSLIKDDHQQNVTTIRLSFDSNQQVNRFDFKIRNLKYDHHATVYTNKTELQKHRLIAYRYTLSEFDLSPDQPLWFDVPKINEKELFIDIEIKNDTALDIESIQCKQLATYLICRFDSLNTYTLKCGNLNLNLPDYEAFQDTTTNAQFMPDAVLRLKKIPVIKLPPVEKQKSFFESKPFLWFCLAFGAATIIFSSIVLLKDMGKRTE